MSIIMAMLAAVLMFFSVTPRVEASAATSNYGKATTQVITVVTKANWWIPGSESITLSQSKGTTKNIIWSKKTKKEYATWKITIKSTDGKHTDTVSMSGSTKRINLKPNKTYKIKVEWHPIANYGKNFIKYPTWKVSKTYKVSQYY